MKILAISSQGGHWIQLKRLLPAFEDSELVLVSTFDSTPSLNNYKAKYYSVTDASRWNKLRLIKQAFQVGWLVLKERPDKIITTGASVGVWAILAGKFTKSKTIWIDSIANFEKLSLSGKIVKSFATYHLTQWPHLAENKTTYKGSVI